MSYTPSAAAKIWPNGVSVPLTTPMKATAEREVDHEALTKQIVRISKAGLQIVLLGTNGEASHLSHSERIEAVKTARKALDSNGFKDAPLLVGTGGGSLQTTIDLTIDSAKAGATHSIVICPGYFAFAMKDDREAIKSFFKGVMDKSPIPVMIYNFPGAAAGIDLNSDEISELADHPMCFGVKLTCAMIGKGHRIAAYTQSDAFLSKKSSFLKGCTDSGLFQILPGFSESLLPAMLSRHQGCITGTGNVFPKTIKLLYEKASAGLKGDAAALQEAIKLQDRVARSDWIIVKAGIPGTKYALDHYVEKGLGGVARFPIGLVSEKTKKMIEEELKEDWEFEKSL